ncbi:Uncharacterised protein (plasmid) [Legionella adelaidensis]|uniref:Uncharacterized protein n=1 Tax=Legionella adelaidensis TaxID=45056 RepID=A0A3S4UT27_9GAMM|nr:Uncharacterised protein [Legionella adelaidensis]
MIKKFAATVKRSIHELAFLGLLEKRLQFILFANNKNKIEK